MDPGVKVNTLSKTTYKSFGKRAVMSYWPVVVFASLQLWASLHL